MKANKFFIVFLVAGSLTSCNYFREHRLFSKDVDTLLDQSVEAAMIEPEFDTTEVYSIVEDAESEATKPSPVVSNQGSSRFLMIAGSFQNENFAARYADQLQQKGYQTEIVYASNGFYRVSAKAYPNYKEGVADIETMRSEVSSNAWLHVKK